jgi:hypothetical protein
VTTILCSTRRSSAVLCLALGAIGLGHTAFAQQASTPQPAKPPAVAPQPPPATPAAVTPQQPAATPPPPSTRTPQHPAAPPVRTGSGAMPQGFSVVLVLADLQASSTADDVPPAARRALVDMKDFLPYKSYRLLDASWVLCCGSTSGRRIEKEGTVLINSDSTATLTLRGLEEQQYELRLGIARGENSRVFVKVTLDSVGDAEASALAAATDSARVLADMQDQQALLETQLKEVRRKIEVGVAPQSEAAKLEVELRAVQRRIADMKSSNRGSGQRGRVGSHSARNRLIDTSFTMDVGETIVVGASRLRGTKALITLLTAVPAKR